MAYVDPLSVQATDPGDILTAAWCDQVRDDLEFLIDPPAVSAYNSAAVSLSDATLTVLNANSENFDNAAMHSTSGSTSRLTCTTDGRYLVFAAVYFAADTTGERLVDFLVNGATQYIGIAVSANTSGSQTTGLTTSRAIVLTAGDYVECRVRQRSGGPLNVTLTEFGAYFMTR